MRTHLHRFSQGCAWIVRATRLYFALSIVVALGLSGELRAATEDEFRCGPLWVVGQFGPFDYRTATAEQKGLVESGHFTIDVERLKSGTGTNSRYPGPDIDYTLRALPNHPRALKAMIELGFRDRSDRPRGLRWTIDCYFNRAIRFVPNDPQVRMIYGIYLLRVGKKQPALEQLEAARGMGEVSGNLSYNLGLAYFQVQDYEKAREYAYKARELGFDLMGLQSLLTRAGQWKEPEKKVEADKQSEVKGTEAPTK